MGRLFAGHGHLDVGMIVEFVGNLGTAEGIWHTNLDSSLLTQRD
jgi:hypothetical protein